MSMKMDDHSNDRESLTTRYEFAANAGFFAGKRIPARQNYRLKN